MYMDLLGIQNDLHLQLKVALTIINCEVNTKTHLFFTMKK